MKRARQTIAGRLKMSPAMRSVLVDTVVCALRDAIDVERIVGFEERLSEVMLLAGWPEEGFVPDDGLRSEARAIAAGFVDDAFDEVYEQLRGLRCVNDCDVIDARLGVEREGAL